MNLLELIAALLGVVSVWFVVRRNIWAFPIGIVMVSIYAVVFYQAKFYADMFLQGVYVLMQIQGWYEWSKGERAADERIAIRRMNTRQWSVSAILLVTGTFFAGFALQRWTDAALPYIDALTTAISLLAQWWMNRKYLENWLLWIVVDVIYLYQYSYKELYLTTLLYAVFLGMAILGYREWRRQEWRATGDKTT